MPNPEASERLNVLHIASWYPSRMSPQNGNFIHRHIDAIGRKTNSFALHVVSDPNLDDVDIMVKEFADYQSVVVTYPQGGFFSRFSRNKKAHHSGFQRISALCSKFDLIHVHVMFPAIAFAQNLAEDLGIPLVVTEHATAYHAYHPQSYKWWQKWFLKKYSRSVQRYFPVSQDLQKSMIQKGIQGDYEVIPNVVDTNLFQPSEQAKPTETIEFIHISSLKDEHKNVSGLLSVFTEVIEAHPQARLTIIGNSHHEQIRRYILLLKLSNHVRLQEEVPLDKIATALGQSHALVLFSNYENAPCVISEAHCSGIPVIATDVGGVSEMIDASNGLLVQSGDVFGMYAAMCKMVEDYDAYDAVAINHDASQKYAYEVVAQTYVEAYEQVRNRFK